MKINALKNIKKIPFLLLLSVAWDGSAAADCPASGSAIHANQLGFLPSNRKMAVLVSDSPAPVAWRLRSYAGEIEARGHTRVVGEDLLSGLHLHQLEVGNEVRSSTGLRLETDCADSHPFAVGPTVYAELPFDALAYFYQNRSGVPVEAEFTGDPKLARPAGHEQDSATCISGEDNFGNDWPGCSYTLDVTGGWYDAGDHGKYVVNGGIATWTLVNAWERQQVLGKPELFRDGSATIPEGNNAVNDLLDEARVEMEFLLRMQAPAEAVAQVPVGLRRAGEDLAFSRIDAAGMAHHKVADISWAAMPMPPQFNTLERVLHPVSTAATLNLAATAAQCARVWRDIDPAFSARCLTAAEAAWQAAARNPEVYFIAPFTGSGMYGDGELGDEFFWAAAELLVTTGDPEYARFVRGSAYFAAAPATAAGWPAVAPLGLITLALLPSPLDEAEVQGIRKNLVATAARFAEEQAETGYGIPFSSDRYVWGSNSVLLNRAILLGLAFDFTGEARYRDAVINVLDYLLGRNPLDVSYISGYGENPMRHPHHRHWAPTYDADLPGPPAGALSGGPNNTAMADPIAKEIAGHCAPQTCWRDHAEAYALNEVAINWNAPLVWVAAWANESD